MKKKSLSYLISLPYNPPHFLKIPHIFQSLRADPPLFSNPKINSVCLDKILDELKIESCGVEN